MIEGKRQKQVASVLQADLNEIFTKLALNMMGGGMVSIASVKVTPDLLEARIYISMFQIADKDLAMKKIEDRAWEVKKLLADKIKGQVRRIPVIHYFLDDTLDQVFKMEEVFKNLAEGKV
ncbi:ribosome-binding factor A [Parasediminibacterium sp. JCM 36343]|uniref:ribosome-binding factor A n=1 Tax=Parasediminibacterium sp. JCM 36343 TaxID=3374279 RepID=UPI003979701A